MLVLQLYQSLHSVVLVQHSNTFEVSYSFLIELVAVQRNDLVFFLKLAEFIGGFFLFWFKKVPLSSLLQVDFYIEVVCVALVNLLEALLYFSCGLFDQHPVKLYHQVRFVPCHSFCHLLTESL